MAVGRPDRFQQFAKEAGPLAPGAYRVVVTDPWGAVHDFPDLPSARKFADDVASEGDYEDIPPAAYIYDSGFEKVEDGMHYAERARRGTAGPPIRGVIGRVQAGWRRLFPGG